MSRRYALDASAAAAWFLPDEADAASAALLRALEDDTAVVPALWHSEIVNILRAAERRRRLTAAEADRSLARIARLPIETDEADMPTLRPRLLGLARLHELTAYDATYLDLAMRRGLPLATRDRDLRRAAGEVGVALLDA